MPADLVVSQKIMMKYLIILAIFGYSNYLQCADERQLFQRYLDLTSKCTVFILKGSDNTSYNIESDSIILPTISVGMKEYHVVKSEGKAFSFNPKKLGEFINGIEDVGVQCLCMPVPSIAIVLYSKDTDEKYNRIGTILFSENHNEIEVISKEGTILMFKRGQKSVNGKFENTFLINDMLNLLN